MPLHRTGEVICQSVIGFMTLEIQSIELTSVPFITRINRLLQFQFSCRISATSLLERPLVAIVLSCVAYVHR